MVRPMLFLFNHYPLLKGCERLLMMIKRLQIFLCAVVAAFFCACENPVEPNGGAEPEDIPVDNSAGSCVPVTFPSEFIFLSWYELVNINNESLLNEYREFATEWRLKMLKDAGFNVYFDYRLNSLEEAEALLKLGDNTGMKIILECPELHDSAQTAMAVKAMSAHPSLYGYNVWDEPELFEYPEMIRRIKEIYKYDKKRPCYVNLFPNYGWDDWVEERYLETLRHYLKNVPVSFLSFDYYPVIIDEDGNRTLRDAWYHNLEDIRTAAKEANVPIWSFALAKPHNPYPYPTLADLRVQHFSNLVYGAVAFQYFTTRAIVWKNAVVADIYPIVKQVNGELKQMETIFLGADIKDIWHIGAEIPRGTKALEAYPAGVTRIDTGDSGAVVSYFTNHGKQYIAVVNRSCTDDMTLEVEFDAQAAHVAKDGTETAVEQSYAVEAGDIRIFTWQ